MASNSRAFRQGAVGAAIGIVIGACLAWPIISQGRAGPRVPSKPPDERNRYVHPCGIAIVVPDGWEVGLAPSDMPHLTIWPHSPLPSRGRAGINIRLLDDKPDSIDFVKTSFQGTPAFEKMRIVRKWSHDDKALSDYTLFVERDNKWWEVSYYIDEERTELPAMIRQYLNTIRWSTTPPR
jgi:hypothetical protein